MILRLKYTSKINRFKSIYLIINLNTKEFYTYNYNTISNEKYYLTTQGKLVNDNDIECYSKDDLLKLINSLRESDDFKEN